jgi:hypothetical protein
MTVSKFTSPPKDLEDQKKLSRLQSSSILGLMHGRSNNVLDVTVTENVAATTVTDDRIGVHTVALAVPTNVNSEAAAIWPYRDISATVNGSMSLIHTNDANTDKTYKIILIG